VAGIKRISSASAIAALSISITAIAQEPSGSEVETVVVTGVREALAKGLENKREATQVIESIVAEDIGKLPDNNVIEALQRVTGIQITNRGGGEAGGGDQPGIFIRGLPDITTTWNGRNVFTGVGRSLALQDIPSNLIGRIDVFKTRASEQIETGLAGQIDVRTRLPFDLPGFEFSVAARGTNQDQRGENIDPNISMLAANSWDGDDGRFGALINVSFARSRYRDQSVTAGAQVPFATVTGPLPPGFTPLQRIFDGWPTGLDRGLPYEAGSTLNLGGTEYPYFLARDALFASDFEGNRNRPAANIALQWAPNDSSEYTFEAFYQGYREEMFNNLHFTFADWWGALGPDPASTIELFPDTNIIKSRVVGFPFGFNSGDSTQQSTDTFVYALNGKWDVTDKLSLEADLSIQESQFDTSFIAVRTERVPEGITLDFNAGSGIPSWHFTNAAGDNIDENMLDATQWNMGQLFQNRGKDIGRGKTLHLDGDYEFGDSGVFRRLSFGVRYDDRAAVHHQPVTTNAPFIPGPGPVTLADAQIRVGGTGFASRNRNFMSGEADVPTRWVVPDGFWINNHSREVRELYGENPDGPAMVRSYEVEERTASAYVQQDFAFGDKFTAQVGVRYSEVSTPIEFNNLVLAGTPETRAGSSVDDIMPSVTLRYSVTDDFRLRANYGETLRRPAFADLNPNFTLVQDLTNVGYGTGTGGNPDLVAAKGKNYDLTAEWYFAEDSAIYGTIFRREIDGLVVPFVQELIIPGTGLNVDRFKVTRPVNASDGELEGIELGFLYFPELPGILNGLGVQGSFTKLDSTQNIPRFDATGTIVGEDTSEFFGVSDFSYNVTLAYDHGGFGGRLSYVWRDDFLNNNEARIFANPIGIWRAPEASLDFQLNYDFSENLAVSFDAVNLTEELQQSYYKFADAGSPTLTNFGTTLISRSYAIGIRWKL
jgi:TonB-dependent receptor